MDEDIELEEESIEPANFEDDPFDAWRDEHPDEWEKMLGR